MLGCKNIFRWIVLGVGILALGACAETEFVFQTAKKIGEPSPDTPLYKVGKPYQIKSVWYYPAVNYEYDETGIASWYGQKFHGRKTANGETFDMNEVSGAHKTLPLPSYVSVTNLENGRQITLRINDRGPFAHGRILDVSRRAAQLLGFHGKGTARVRVKALGARSRSVAAKLQGKEMAAAGNMPIKVDSLPKPKVSSQTLAPPPGASVTPAKSPPPAPLPSNGARAVLPSAGPGAPGPGAATLTPVTTVPVTSTRIYIQAGAFSQFTNANRVRARLLPLGNVRLTSVMVNGRDLYRVRLGPISTVNDADKLLASVIDAGYNDSRIIVD